MSTQGTGGREAPWRVTVASAPRVVLTGTGCAVPSALAARTGSPAVELGNDAPFAGAGVGSVDLVELLVSVSDQIAAEHGVAPDALTDPGLPLIGIVGRLVELSSSAVDARVPVRR